jgi:hypothetical protein
MIGLLSTIVATLEASGTVMLWAIVSGWNLIAAAIGAAVVAAFALLPAMSDAPAINGQWLGWLNWFFPVGDFLSILTSGVTLYVGYLAVRYVLRLVRAL